VRFAPVNRRDVGRLSMFGRKKQSMDDQAGQILFRCSFCNNSQKEVRRLIAGPTVYICDECVRICFQVLNQEKEAEASSSASAAADGAVTCSLCRIVALPAGAVILPGRAPLCSPCATAVAEAVGKNEQPPN
jgi:hypothetical protein